MKRCYPRPRRDNAKGLPIDDIKSGRPKAGKRPLRRRSATQDGRMTRSHDGILALPRRPLSTTATRYTHLSSSSSRHTSSTSCGSRGRLDEEAAAAAHRHPLHRAVCLLSRGQQQPGVATTDSSSQGQGASIEIEIPVLRRSKRAATDFFDTSYLPHAMPPSPRVAGGSVLEGDDEEEEQLRLTRPSSGYRDLDYPPPSPRTGTKYDPVLTIVDQLASSSGPSTTTSTSTADALLKDAEQQKPRKREGLRTCCNSKVPRSWCIARIIITIFLHPPQRNQLLLP